MDTNGEVTEAPRVEKPETEGMSPIDRRSVQLKSSGRGEKIKEGRINGHKDLKD